MRGFRRGATAVAMATMLAVLAAPASAADGGTGSQLVRFVVDAGLIGWVILALSLVVGALWIEYLVNLKRSVLMPEDMLEELEEPAGDGDTDAAMRLCEQAPGFFTNILAAGLTHARLGATHASDAMQHTREEETAKLLSKIGWLKLIADIAPMLGLLGTVWGMMRAVSRYGSGNMEQFASQGIGLALITTLLGLIVAIIATSVYFFFRTRVVRLSIEIGEVAEALVLRIARGSKSS